MSVASFLVVSPVHVILTSRKTFVFRDRRPLFCSPWGSVALPYVMQRPMPGKGKLTQANGSTRRQPPLGHASHLPVTQRKSTESVKSPGHEMQVWTSALPLSAWGPRSQGWPAPGDRQGGQTSGMPGPGAPPLRPTKGWEGMPSPAPHQVHVLAMTIYSHIPWEVP